MLAIGNVISDLQELRNPAKAESLQRFFKTGKGQYGYGDIFWGITVPLNRKVALKYKHMAISDEFEELLTHEVHEVRLCALLIMVAKSKIAGQQMYDLYLNNTHFINNWDLVDLSAPTIVGDFLLNKDVSILHKLAQSSLLWEKRIAIVATYAFIKRGNHEHTIQIAQILMDDKHDLIHKAVGWMLREVGKRCSVEILEKFLEQYAATMPRTMLRYSIEHLPPEKKTYFMQAKDKQSKKTAMKDLL